MDRSGVRIQGVFGLALLVLFLEVACAHKPQPEIIPGENYWQDRDTSPYILGWGDSISITVQRHPEFTGTATVQRDGTIVVPYDPLRALPQALAEPVPPVEVPMESAEPEVREKLESEPQSMEEEGLSGVFSKTRDYEGLLRLIRETGKLEDSEESVTEEARPERPSPPQRPIIEETAYPKEKLILRVEGLTVPQVEAKLRELLEQFIIEPQVYVEVVDYQSKYVWVVGEVGVEGKVPIQGNYIRVREAVFRAGWKPDLARLGHAKVIRPDITHPRVEEIDLKALIYRGELRHNLRLNHGDILFVPELRAEKITFWVREALKPFESLAGVILFGVLLNQLGL